LAIFPQIPDSHQEPPDLFAMPAKLNDENSNMAHPATNDSDNPAKQLDKVLGDIMGVAFTLQKLSNEADERSHYKEPFFVIAHKLGKAVEKFKESTATNRLRRSPRNLKRGRQEADKEGEEEKKEDKHQKKKRATTKRAKAGGSKAAQRRR
jgi:hypothetical protein